MMKKPIKLKSTIRRIILEEKAKKEARQILPEPGEDYSQIVPHERDKKSKEEILDDIEKTAADIDKDIVVVWDDHDDISVNYRDLFNVRIIPRWENNYDIEAYLRNEDRIRVFNLTLDQVKAFIKQNFKDMVSTYVDSAKEKVDDNREDKVEGSDKKMPQKDKVKIKEPEEMETMGDGSKPDDPMEDAKEPKKQRDYKVQKPVKIRKKHDNKRHVVKPK